MEPKVGVWNPRFKGSERGCLESSGLPYRCQSTVRRRSAVTGCFAATDFEDRRGIVFDSGSKYGRLSKCPRSWDGLEIWADPLEKLGMTPWMG
jgi:hypothetical protein